MKKKKVAFQGERGAYSELAAHQFFGNSIDVLPCTDFESVFRTLKKSSRMFGIIPIENSLTGSIHENYDLLLNSRVPIIGEIKLRISHALIALPKTKMRDIKTVYSHPQALAQCRNYLKKLKKVKVVASEDTAGSVKMIRENKLANCAAIASLQAAVDYRMNVLAQNLESNKANYTRFLVLGPGPVKKNRQMKTSVVYAAKNIPGALFKSLSVFAMREIDLCKIESRPIHGKPWAYMFYLDFEGSQKGEAPRHALSHLKELTIFMKVLGSYPVGREYEPKYIKRKIK